MTPREMADHLLQLAAGPCTQTFGEARLSCREYDADALYDGRQGGGCCPRCQALNALDFLREPWKSDLKAANAQLARIRMVVGQ